MILILSRREDEHVVRVIRELARRGEEHCWFDPAFFPARARLSVTFAPDGTQLRRLSFDGRHLDLGDVRAVWYRRPGQPVAEVADPEVRRWVGREARALLEGVWESLACRWVPGPPVVGFRAEKKAYQLGVAREMGFKVPRTLMTNDPAAVLRFYEECEGNAVVKTLFNPAVQIGSETYLSFTAPVRRRDLRSYREMRHGPAILQEYVPKQMEVRVNVFGERTLAAEIHSQQSPWTLHDWRFYDCDRAPHLPHQLPIEVERRCIRYVAALGLCSGHIDLILTPAGEYVFLEINPFGQWAWLEDVAGLALTEALTDLLLADARPVPQAASDACPGRPRPAR
ncbi:MAG: MvdC/MvdD family ATP grasp protein [Candidatus Rokuibacteriota bacterium]